MGRTVLLASEVPKNQSVEALQFATYTKNRIPHKALTTVKTLIEVLCPETDIMGERRNLRKFGEQVIVYDYGAKDKLAARSHRGRIVGYTNTRGIYWTIRPTGKKELAKDPRPITPKPKEWELPIIQDTQLSDQDGYETALAGYRTPSPEPKAVQDPEVPLVPRKRRSRKTPEEFTMLYGSRCSIRTKRPTWKTTDNKKRITEDDPFGSKDVSAVRTDPDHPTHEQVLERKDATQWAKAREKERMQLRKYGVYEVVSNLPPGIKPISTKWVYIVKRKADGTVEQYKARKVGRGFSQVKGVNYKETNAQTMQIETFRILLALSIQRGWKMYQWDVVAAYLQAPLQHEIYVQDDEGGRTKYWKLKKALYGLKQAGHEWYQMMGRIMNSAGYVRCIGDEGLFKNKVTASSVIGT